MSRGASPGRGPWLAVLAAPLAVVAAQFTAVRATNFASHDEWLVLSLLSRDIVDFPYAHRPLALLWSLPGEWFLPHDVRGHLVTTLFYLAASGTLVAWLALRRLGLPAGVALLAGVFTATWAPLDRMRLDTLLVGTRYGGTTAASLAAMVLFVEGFRRARPALAAAGAILAVATVLGLEGAVPLLAAAPLLVLAAQPEALRDGLLRRRLLLWSVAWEIALCAALAPLLLSLVQPRASGYNYQSAAGIDPHPGRLAASLLQQFGFSLGPLVSTPLAELGRRSVPLAVAALALAFVAVGRAAAVDTDDRRSLARMALLGALLAILGWIGLVVSPLIRSSARTQLLSAPGIGLLIACALGWVASLVPGRARPLVLAVTGAWVVAVGAGRVGALQDGWDADSYWPRQRAALVQIVAQAPSLAPNTLVILVDESRSWLVNFGFRGAIQYLYGERVVGLIGQGSEFLYGTRYDADGIRSEPWPVIQRPWHSPPTLHRYDEVVVVRLFADGSLRVLDGWPAELPALPPGAVYAPRARIGPGPPPPASRILSRER